MKFVVSISVMQFSTALADRVRSWILGVIVSLFSPSNKNLCTLQEVLLYVFYVCKWFPTFSNTLWNDIAGPCSLRFSVLNVLLCLRYFGTAILIDSAWTDLFITFFPYACTLLTGQKAQSWGLLFRFAHSSLLKVTSVRFVFSGKG